MAQRSTEKRRFKEVFRRTPQETLSLVRVCQKMFVIVPEEPLYYQLKTRKYYDIIKSGDDEMNQRYHLPKRYWFYMIIILLFSVLLFANIYRTDVWTGDKPFSEFAQHDWHLFLVFLFEQVIIIGIIFLFAFLSSRIYKERNKKIAAQWEKDKYLGIVSGDYDYIWFDFSLPRRALISKQADKFCLHIQEFNRSTENWESHTEINLYDSLEAIKKALFYEYDFYCEENTELNKYGDEVYKE